MNYEDMSNKQINKKVAVVNGLKESPVSDMMYGDGLVVYPHSNEVNFDPCNNPSDAWPIIVENEIDIYFNSSDGHGAYKHIDNNSGIDTPCKNPLRAAMICFLKMKDEEK